jgi:hypothetical protein
MIELQSDFYFRGERSYVFFPTIFNVFIESVRQYVGDNTSCLSIEYYKIHKEVVNNSSIKIYEYSKLKGLAFKENLIAELKCSINDENYFVGLYNENLKTIFKRVRSVEKELVGKIRKIKPFSGYCNNIIFQNNYELIQACCETNKQLHFMSLPESEIPHNVKSVMLMDYDCNNSIVASEEARLEICNIGIWENINHIYTCNSIELNAKGLKKNFRLFYATKKKVS